MNISFYNYKRLQNKLNDDPSSMLQDAVEWQIIASNPVMRVKAPRFQRKEAACYDEEQTPALLKALGTEPIKYQLMVILAIFGGLRRGEIMGLEWSDVDFGKNIIDIKRSNQYVSGKGIIAKDPKTASSKRLIAMPEFIMVMLKQYKISQNEERLMAGELWKDSGRLFTTWDGQPMHPDTPSKWFPKFLKHNNLPPLPFHGLRHTVATL